jgi:hypothetical protein
MEYLNIIQESHPTIAVQRGDGNFYTGDGEKVDVSDEIKIKAKAKADQEYDAQAYARNRASDYPSNGDQWDMIYKDNLNSTTTHKDAVEAVKTKWPKDNTGPVE